MKKTLFAVTVIATSLVIGVAAQETAATKDEAATTARGASTGKAKNKVQSPRDSATGQASGKSTEVQTPRDSATGQASGKVQSPRDAATGQASGKRTVAPGETTSDDASGADSQKKATINTTRSNIKHQ